MLSYNDIDSIFIVCRPKDVFTPPYAISREALLKYENLEKKTIKGHRENQDLISLINKQDFICEMDYDERKMDKTLQVVEVNKKKGLLWLNDSEDYMGLIVLLRKDRYEFIWFSQYYVYHNRGKYRCSDDLLDFIYKLK